MSEQADSIESNGLSNAIKPRVRRIIENDDNWSKEYMMEICPYCNKLLQNEDENGEDGDYNEWDDNFKQPDIPLHLWREISENEVWSISFHQECAFFMKDGFQILSLETALKEIKKKFFLQKEELKFDELDYLKDYIVSFIDQLVIGMGNKFAPPNYRKKIESLNQKELNSYLANELMEYNIDPL